MKKILLVSVYALLAGIAILLVLNVSPDNTDKEDAPIACTKDALVCPDGSTVGRQGQNCEFASCPQDKDTTPKDTHELIVLEYPEENAVVSSPITFTGQARGNWYFEATFPIVIVNWNGLIIGEGYATADGDWMTTEFVPFAATVSYDIDPETPYDRGAVILQKSNASGLPEFDDAIEIPVRFSELVN